MQKRPTECSPIKWQKGAKNRGKTSWNAHRGLSFCLLTTDRMSHQPTNWVKVWGRSWLVAPSKIPSLNTFKWEDIYFDYLFSIFASGKWILLPSCLPPHLKESARSQGVFFTPGDFLLHPHIRDLEGGRREIRNPPRDLVNTHNKHASPHEILVSRLSAKGGEAKQGGCHFLSSHLTTLQLCFLMTNHFLCLFLAVHACLSI